MAETRGGTGTPPSGEVPSQAPVPVEERLRILGARLDATEVRLERLQSLFASGGEQFNEILTNIINRHNFLEKLFQAYRREEIHDPSAINLYLNPAVFNALLEFEDRFRPHSQETIVVVPLGDDVPPALEPPNAEEETESE